MPDNPYDTVSPLMERLFKMAAWGKEQELERQKAADVAAYNSRMAGVSERGADVADADLALRQEQDRRAEADWWLKYGAGRRADELNKKSSDITMGVLDRMGGNPTDAAVVAGIPGIKPTLQVEQENTAAERDLANGLALVAPQIEAQLTTSMLDWARNFAAQGGRFTAEGAEAMDRIQRGEAKPGDFTTVLSSMGQDVDLMWQLGANTMRRMTNSGEYSGPSREALGAIANFYDGMLELNKQTNEVMLKLGDPNVELEDKERNILVYNLAAQAQMLRSRSRMMLAMGVPVADPGDAFWDVYSPDKLGPALTKGPGFFARLRGEAAEQAFGTLDMDPQRMFEIGQAFGGGGVVPLGGVPGGAPGGIVPFVVPGATQPPPGDAPPETAPPGAPAPEATAPTPEAGLPLEPPTPREVEALDYVRALSGLSPTQEAPTARGYVSDLFKENETVRTLFGDLVAPLELEQYLKTQGLRAGMLAAAPLLQKFADLKWAASGQAGPPAPPAKVRKRALREREAQDAKAEEAAFNKLVGGTTDSGLPKGKPYKSFDKVSMDDINTIVNAAARRYELDPDELLAMMGQESAYNPLAISGKGASGLMQLMPATAAELGVTDIFDPVQNIFAGALYYKEQLDRFKDPTLARIAYNAGPGYTRRWLSEGGDMGTLYAEPREYTRKIDERLAKIKASKAGR